MNQMLLRLLIVCSHHCIDYWIDLTSDKIAAGNIVPERPASFLDHREHQAPVKNASGCPRSWTAGWFILHHSRAFSIVAVGEFDCCCTHSELKTFRERLSGKMAANMTIMSQKKIQSSLKFCRKSKNGHQKTSAKLYALIRPPSNYLDI